VAGGVFALAGASFLVHGAAGVGRNARGRRVAAALPHEPWRADFRWDERGVRDDNLRHALKPMWFAVVLVAFLVPFHWWAFFSKIGPWPVKAIVGLFDLIALLPLGQGAYRLLQLAKYGRSELRYDRFPYFLGDAMGARFVNSRGLGEFRNLTFTLRCLEEQYETRTSGNERQQVVVVYQLYADSLPLPAGDYATRLAQSPPRY
jgi:hypothetical protein